MGIAQNTAALATTAQISPAFFDMMFSFWIVELIYSTGPAANRSGIEAKRVLRDVCSRKSGHKSARSCTQQVRQLRHFATFTAIRRASSRVSNDAAYN
jgi:hypothetical protein